MARVYRAVAMGEADIRVAIVKDRSDADLLVHRVGSPGLATEEAYWFITRNRQEATTVISVTSRGMAQLLVCFVDSFSEAGWVKPDHRLKGKLR